MPEGDTIFRAARTLHRALAGHEVVEFASMFPALNRVKIAGRTVERVRSAGKHLIMEFSGGPVLRTHMRMHGSWHIYRRGERWHRPRRDMRIVIATRTFEAVGFSIPDAEMIESGGVHRNRQLRALGPDLLSDDFDEAQAVARIRSRAGAAIAGTLLNQRVLAGIGNVYKSEVLFVCRVHPLTRVDALEDARIAAIVATARRLLCSNVSEALRMTASTGYRRTTGRDDPAGRLWVYGRAGLPCRRCGTPISLGLEGTAARVTYWCPDCQPE